MINSNDNNNVTYVKITEILTYNRHLLVILSLTAAIATVFTILSNATVIVAMVCSYVRRPTATTGQVHSSAVAKILMTSMAVSDALVGAIIMPMATNEMVNNGNWTFSPHVCKYRALIDILLCTVSIYHVLFMAVDRYLAVCRPLVYRKLSRRNAVYMVAFCWIFPNSIFVFPVVFGWAQHNVDKIIDKQSVNFFCMLSFTTAFSTIGAILAFFAPFAVVFILYFLIVVDVRRFHKNRIEKFKGNLAITRLKLITDKVEKAASFVNQASLSKNIADAHSGLIAKPTISEQKNEKLCLDQAPPNVLVSFRHTRKYSQTTQNHFDNPVCTLSSQVFSMDGGNMKMSSQMYPKSNEMSTSNVQSNSKRHEKNNTFSQIKSSAPKSASMKAYRTIGLIVIVFTACWLPLAVFQSVLSGVHGLEIHMWTMTSLSWLGYLNSALNPMLFCCHRSVRESVRRLLYV